MKLIDQTFPSPEENLRFDEHLLDAEKEALRFWESDRYFIVLGAGNKQGAEVRDGVDIPVLRRVSGGGCVLQGPGCLNYALVLDIESRPELAKIDTTNRYVMAKNREALLNLLPDVHVRGITDLALGHLKFSGNAQRRKRRFILFHGTFLYDFDIAMIEKTLKMPPKQPDYRQSRAHRDFVVNIPLTADAIKSEMKRVWVA